LIFDLLILYLKIDLCMLNARFLIVILNWFNSFLTVNSNDKSRILLILNLSRLCMSLIEFIDLSFFEIISFWIFSILLILIWDNFFLIWFDLKVNSCKTDSFSSTFIFFEVASSRSSSSFWWISLSSTMKSNLAFFLSVTAIFLTSDFSMTARLCFIADL